ncbi:MAG: ribosomal RNA small subunit methyltransferase A [Ignavibacteriae bacterium]|nr:ribosomal RNA small subunit methyltransferase A [Ignavibacteriota bacterium]
MKTREKYEFYKPKKIFGQNFLVDDNISQKIIRQLDITDSDLVLEIGPGQGALTKHLAELEERYTAVEIDNAIASGLGIKYGSRINIINQDFLKFDLSQFGKKIKIVGNLPYNIASEILFRLFEFRGKIICAVLMVQKEFAQRLVAKPDSKEYGILSVQTQVFSRPSLLFSVPPTVFFPKPKVESSVIKLCFDNETDLKSISIFKALVRASFGKRRKIIKNSLKEYFEKTNISFDDLDFDFTRRAENVKVEEYVALANRIINLIPDAQ